MLDLKTFVESDLRPQLEAVDLSSVEVKSVSECEAMTRDSVVNGTFVITCDNPVWLAKSTNARGEVSWFSNNGDDHVYMPLGKRFSLLKYLPFNGKMQMAGTHAMKFVDDEQAIALPAVNQTILKEETTMANGDLDDIMKDAGNEVNPQIDPNVKPLDKFGEAGAPAKDPAAKDSKKGDKEAMESLRKQIREDINAARSQNPIDMSIVQALWQKNAQLIAFVASTDKRQSITAVKVPVKAAQRELVDTAPEAVRANFLKNPTAVDPQWIKTTYEIKGREAKPGKPVGVIIQIPAFLKDCSVMDYIKQNVISTAEMALKGGDNSTAIELCTMNDFEQKLTFVGCAINESPVTAPEGGKPGEIKILYGQPANSTSKDKGVINTNGTQFAKKIVKTGQGNKTPMHDRNYFPLTTYETVDINGPMSPELVADLNRYTFEGLFTPGKNSKQTGTKHANLSAEDKAKVVKEGGNITSAFITTGANREKVTISAFYDKAVARDSVLIPLKRQNPKPDGTLGAAQFIKYSVTMDEKMTDEEYFNKSSLGLEQFAHIVEATGADQLTPAILKEKFKRGGGNSSVSKYLNADIARELLIAKMGGGLNNYNITGFVFDK